ncbi:MAG TPA: sigma-70 family RNA polymerase sigma factor [Baekduia sp.]|nr:sigma-70 family RNA polymerase sigma factor [Baekduia sp.]
MSDTSILTMISPTNTSTSRFDALYRTNAADIYAYVASLLGDRASAEDVTAQAFERAYRRRRSFDARRGNERAWLFGIARNAALDELRRRKRRATLVLDPEDPAALAAFEEDETSARWLTVTAALATLDARERELIALKFHAGLSNAEIAAVTKTSETNAGTRLHRAITRLREACNDTA